MRLKKDSNIGLYDSRFEKESCGLGFVAISIEIYLAGVFHTFFLSDGSALKYTHPSCTIPSAVVQRT